MKTHGWVSPYVKRFKGRMLLTVGFGALGIGSGAMLLFISGYLISKSALRPENIMLVYVPIVAVRAFSIGRAVFPYLERLLGHDVVLRILANMRVTLYRMLEPQAVWLRSRYQTGDLLSVLSDDIEHLQDVYLRTLFPSAASLMIYSAFAGAVGWFDGVFAVMAALMLGVILFFVPLVSLLANRGQHEGRKHRRNLLYKQATDAIFGLSDWLASGREREWLTRFHNQTHPLHAIDRRIKQRRRLLGGVNQLASGLTVVMMIVWTGGEAESGQLAPTLIAAFVLMSLSVADALIPVTEAAERLPVYRDSLHRLRRVQQTACKTAKTTPGRIPAISARQEPNETNAAGARDASIRIDALSYCYPESEEMLLREVTLTVPHGKKMAILGRSGSGKSTLLKLLAGVVRPTSGTVLIGGQPAHRQLLGETIAVLNQAPHLFDAPIAHNIRLGRPDAPEEDVWEAAEQAQIASLIRTLPQGLDTPMHEMGTRFSGGERQRIAFARVLLQNTPILLLDEPTTGLDPKTEHALLKTIFSAASDKTVIWVTHHLAGVRHMDNIIFLENGRIVLQGSHDQLMATSKKYRMLYAMDQGLKTC